jgi:3-hydroxyisobutyrate dehydrogenase-like beta-hydroxyacid dehydrogenase
MGAPMAGHLAAAGYKVTVMDLNEAVAKKLAAAYKSMTAVSTIGAVGEA